MAKRSKRAKKRATVKRDDTADSSSSKHIFSNTLPPEILCEIFILTAMASVETNDNGIEACAIGWIKSTSHVCQQWRNAALGCPELWSRIIFSHTNWAEEMLERSKTMPLVIRATVTCKSVLDRVQLALSHISRIRELRLQATVYDMQELLETIIYKDAPNLEYLRLAKSYEIWSDYSRVSGLSVYILPDSSFESAKKLHRMEFRNCAIRWTSPLLGRLTHLSLRKPVSLFSPAPTVTQFMDVLKLMSNLETLELEDGFPSATSGPWPANRIVHLPHLSRLSLKAQIWNLIDVLEHISYPRSTALTIASDHMWKHEDDAIYLVPYLYTNSPLELEIPLRCLKLVYMSPNIVKLISWTDDTSASFPPPIETAKIDICLTRCPSTMRMEPLMTEFSKLLPLHHLQTAHIAFALEKTPVDWLSILQSLNSIHNICLSGLGTSGVVTTLLEDMRSSAPEGKADILLPDLQTLVFKCVLFHDLDSNAERSPRATEGFVALDDLRDLLIRRYEIGAEITQIKLYHCDLNAEQLDLLREIVVDVRVASILDPMNWVDMPL